MIKYAEYTKVAQEYGLSTDQAVFYCSFINEIEKNGHVSDYEKVAMLNAIKNTAKGLYNKASMAAASAYSNPTVATMMANPSLAPAMLSSAGATSVGALAANTVAGKAVQKGVTSGAKTTGNLLKNTPINVGRNNQYTMRIAGKNKWQLQDSAGNIVNPRAALNRGDISRARFDYITKQQQSNTLSTKFNDAMTNVADSFGKALSSNSKSLGEVATMF